MGALLLDSINQPRDLKQLNEQQVKQLCAEIRQFLLENISKTGGHLASNLGVVELTVALHRVLDTPQDKIVFDVGHQCYTHKILTGRRGQFDKLRQLDGISGFPNPNESEHDAFIAGHGNTALSLAIGMAWAKKLHHEAGLVVAVIGDGAFTGGMVYEDALPQIFGDMRWGAGLGLRYYTPIGPVRLDVATPLNPVDGDPPLQLYISIGQSF